MYFETSDQTPNQLTSSDVLNISIREWWAYLHWAKWKEVIESDRPLGILEGAQALAEGPWARAAFWRPWNLDSNSFKVHMLEKQGVGMRSEPKEQALPVRPNTNSLSLITLWIRYRGIFKWKRKEILKEAWLKLFAYRGSFVRIAPTILNNFVTQQQQQHLQDHIRLCPWPGNIGNLLVRIYGVRLDGAYSFHNVHGYTLNT